MINLAAVIMSMQIFAAVSTATPWLFVQAKIESINVHCIISDSLSQEPIPLVKVTIENLGKSFKTTRSGFYALLATNTYNFLLEADGYEGLRKSIFVSSKNNEITFEMIKISDRIALEAKQETLNLYLNSFDNTLRNRAFPEAERLMAMIENLSVPSTMVDSIYTLYENAKTVWIDSLLQIAREFEESSEFAEATFYYQQIVDFDSLNIEAREKVDEMNEILARRGKANIPPKTSQELERMYNEAISKFLAEDYNGAYKIFKTFLSYKPGHVGAKDYYERTKARLKALK